MLVLHPVRLLRTAGRQLRRAVPVVVALAVAVPAAAQVYTPATDSGTYEYWSDEIPAHLSVVDGAVSLERDGRVERAETNLILLAGDRLRTERGRVEILFADGSAVAVDEFSTIDLLDAALMRLAEGRVRVIIARATGDVEYRIDTAAGSALLRTPGEFKVALRDAHTTWPEVDLTVYRGSAELANAHGRTLVRAGTHAAARPDAAPSLPYAASVAALDAFDRWADEQRDFRLGYDSARYLPTELHYTAGVFDRYGSWDYEPTYGSYVWYPQVNAGWAPYSVGRWSFVGRFGWVWVGFDRWSWSTHHYGRWGVSRGRWHWIPDRRWGPAWVSWASTPGYIGWCPLGFDNRPVVSITTITVNYNQPYGGWTVVPQGSFGHGVRVADHRVRPGRAIPREWSGFAEQGAPSIPAMRTAAAQPLRSPSTARSAVSRGTGAVAGPPRDTSALLPRQGAVRRATPSATTIRTAPPTTTSQGPAPAAVRRASPAGSPSASAPGTTRSDTNTTRRAVPSTRGALPTVTYGGSTAGNSSRTTSPGSRQAVTRRAPGTVTTPPSSTPPAATPPPRATSSGARRAAPSSRVAAPTTGAPASRSGSVSRSAPPSSSSSSSRATRRSSGGGGGGGGTVSTPPASPPSSPPSRSRASGRSGGGGGGGDTGSSGRTASRRGGGGGVVHFR